MKEKLEARKKELEEKLKRLGTNHSELSHQLQQVANEIIKTQGAYEEVCYHLEQAAGNKARESENSIESRKGEKEK